MELREFAERILFSSSLDEKLDCPSELTDDRPGPALETPVSPGRPRELRFKTSRSGKNQAPSLQELEDADKRGRLLHFFANHELLATELMALVLLRFPEAPADFRQGVLRTLKQEQQHTAWYLNRMKQCGVTFGELPVSGYFWRAVAPMRSPLDYLAGLSLTFEQANLDFTRYFAKGFSDVGDIETSRLLERIYRDEIGHVAYGLKWFRKWKDPARSDWEAFCQALRFPMSAQRAKGPVFNLEGRIEAGLDRQFIDELNVYAQSKGRTPGVFLFNPFAEGRIALGKAFTPNAYQQQLQNDLENLPQFLCRQDDIVLVTRRPSVSFLSGLKLQGWIVPEFVELKPGPVVPEALLLRKLGGLRPWAWSPDSLEVLSPLISNVSEGSSRPANYFNGAVAMLYSKKWAAEFLTRFLDECGHGRFAQEKLPPLCTNDEGGVAASSVSETQLLIRRIRETGHRSIVIKEAIGLAGHNAIRFLEPELSDRQARWIASAIDKGGELIVEPWLQRVLDFSVQLEMDAEGLKLVGYTGLFNDWKGQFRGNSAEPGWRNRVSVGLQRFFPDSPGIALKVHQLYSKIRLLLEPELEKAGYRGPIGIDAFVYRTAKGQNRLKPIVEINPRYTMGRLTLELMRNVAPGRTGTFRLVNRRQIQNAGFKDFPTWARAEQNRCPAQLRGEPVPKLTEGFVCLTDPGQAKVCLAVLNVATTSLFS
ncbi:MAG TPA: DUF455 family protein [Verrucomicrobiae bacterium]|nr:DUF455 family protein [Verrucomicrobiae bacterium]